MKPYLRPLVETSIGPGDRWLRVLTYNVLAQSLISREQYPTNGNLIRVARRYPVLLEEIESYRPNLLMLQEVDRSRVGDWEGLFEKTGMDHKYASAPGKQHGVLIAWDANTFSCDESTVREIYYDDYAEPPPQAPSGNVGLVLLLRRTGTDETYIAGTTHLYWQPRADYERLRQAAILLKNTAELRTECGSSAIVLAADFNSTPDSPAYLYMSRGLRITPDMRADLEHSAAATHFGPIGAPPNTGRLSSLQGTAAQAVDRLVEFAEQISGVEGLQSCYKAVQGCEPAFTNWTTDFKATIDYIFVTKPLVAAAVLELPTPDSMGPEPSSLPRARGGVAYPSDHLALMAELAPGAGTN